MGKEHQEQESKYHQEQEAKKRQKQEAKERQKLEAKERQELKAKERDKTAKEQQETDNYRAEKLLKRDWMPLFPPGRRQWGERQVLKSNRHVLAAK